MPNIAPLDAQETDLAVRLASENEEVRRFRSARFRTLLVEPTTLDRKQADDARQAVVGFYDYDTGRSLLAVVDLTTQEVRAVQETPAQFQLSEEEKQEAAELAAGDPQVRGFLQNREMNPLTRLFFPVTANKDDPPHRYAVVFLRPSDNERRFAVVDLTEGQVSGLAGPEEFTAQ